MSEQSENRKIEELKNDDELVTMDIYHEGGCTTCIVAAILSVPGSEKQYVALLPIDEHGEYSPDDAWFYRYLTDGSAPGAEPEIESITDDDELEAVIDRYDEYRDELAFDELLESEDDESLT